MHQLFKILVLAIALVTPALVDSRAVVVTFDNPGGGVWANPGAKGGTYDGFTLSDNIEFQDPGRPFLQFYDHYHSINHDTAFTFKSIQFHCEPWAGYGNCGSELIFDLLDAHGRSLHYGRVLFYYDTGWTTYTATIAGVHQIQFRPTGYFWPSFDNLVYNSVEEATPVPEPTSFALLAGGLLGLISAQRQKRRAGWLEQLRVPWGWSRRLAAGARPRRRTCQRRAPDTEHT